MQEMDSLLCDEVLVLTPPSVSAVGGRDDNNNDDSEGPRWRWTLTTSDRTCRVAVMRPPPCREDFKEAVRIRVDQERNHMPQPGYVKYLESNTLVYNARCKAVLWMIQCRRRLNISLESVFCAVNYIDRFISTRKCQGWECCMLELLSIACLYVASKFNEMHPPSLHAIQMEGVERPFGSDEIRRMELTVLKTVGWKLHSTTPYSYLQLFMEQWNNNNNVTSLKFTDDDNDDESKTACVANLLLQSLLDPKFVEFRPSFVAEAALHCVIGDILPHDSNHCLYHFTALIPQEQKDDLRKCYEVMEKERRRPSKEAAPPGMHDEEASSSSKIIVDRPSTSSSRKRKRDTLCPTGLILKRGNWKGNAGN